MPDFDVLIRNGMIVDGALDPRYRGDVAIRDGIIVELGRVRGSASVSSTPPDSWSRQGSSTSTPTTTPRCSGIPYCTLSGWHGVTSVAIGNCGFGFAPVRRPSASTPCASMTRVEAIPYDAMRAGMPWRLGERSPSSSTPSSRTPKAVNILPYVPAGPLLVVGASAGSGQGGRAADRRRARAMARMLHDAMDAGALRVVGAAPATVVRTLGATRSGRQRRCPAT